MNVIAGHLCQARSASDRCGICVSELAEPRRRGVSCQVSLRTGRRAFSRIDRKFVVARVFNSTRSRQGRGSVRVQALRTDEERRRLRSRPPDYQPKGPPPTGPLNRLEDELERPLFRGPLRRDAMLKEEDGYPPRRAGFSGRMDDEDGAQPSTSMGGINKYILAGIFVLGMGAGITVDTVLNVEPNNVASREVIDRQTPNPDVCIANGMSAMVLDQRLFISFNPFNVYVSQTEVKPGCVLRQSNWNVLESRGLVTSDEVRACKRNMNTFGFVGDLRQAPEISCVYHSESAENQFLKDPTKATLGDGFQPKTFEE